MSGGQKSRGQMGAVKCRGPPHHIRRKFPQRGPGGAPAENDFMHISGQK